MPVNPCSLESLAAQMPCLDCLSKSEKEALFDYYLILSYSKLLPEPLTPAAVQAEAVCMACEPESRLDTFLVESAINLAVTLGAIPEKPTIDEARAAIKCWGCGLGAKERKAILVMMLCGLFSLQTPPIP